MKNFRRSLKYLWPQRVRLGTAVVCVLFIAVLWAGSLGAILPGMKILISDEGLHGWAWRRSVEARLGLDTVGRPMRGQHAFGDQPLPLGVVLDVVRVKDDGSARAVGIREGEWLVGLDDGSGQRLLSAYDLAEAVAAKPDAGGLRLAVYDPQTRQGRWVGGLGFARLGAGPRLLGTMARHLPNDKFKLLLLLLGFGVVTNVLRDLLRFVQEYLVQIAVYRGLMDLRCENYNVVLHLPVTFFSEKGVSDTMSRFVQDTGELARGHITLFGKTLVEPAKMAASVAVALAINWRLTLLTGIVSPLAFLLLRKFGKIMKRASRRALESWADMLAILEETLTGIRVVKAYTMEPSERKRFFRINRALLRQQAHMAAIDSATSPAVESLGFIAAMAAGVLAGYWVINHSYGMEASDMLALTGALAATFDPIRKLAHVNIRFQQAESAATRVFEMQDRPQEKRVPDAPSLPRHAHGIELRNVSFRYPNASADALKGINLTIAAGETVAIVGPNGCGKTTLVSLLPRLIDPTAGCVLIDGIDLAGVSIRSVRRQIGLVTQDSVLFHATVAENIAYGLRRPDPRHVLEASRKAFVDEFVRDLPDGYETMVGEHGATLSGGQRQRITIARAILRNPSILIFDEAMSQVDPESEQRIHQAMAEFVKGRTCLLIAHRFITVMEADRIVVMDAGRIVDSGRHSELIERCDLYRQLYQTQLMGADAGK